MWAGATGVLRVEHARVNFMDGRGKRNRGAWIRHIETDTQA